MPLRTSHENPYPLTWRMLHDATGVPLVLTGHLLAEDGLDRLLARKVPAPAALRRGRFAFAQKLVLAEALQAVDPTSSTGTGRACAILDRFKDELAHALLTPAYPPFLTHERAKMLYDALGPDRRLPGATVSADADALMRDALWNLCLALRQAT